MLRRYRRWRNLTPRRPDPRGAFRWRLNALRLAVVLLCMVLAAQLWRLQIVEGGTYRRRAELNRLRLVPVLPERGVIYDRSGRQLVRNAPSFTVGVVPADLPEEREEEVTSRLAAMLGADGAEFLRRLREARTERRFFEPVTLARNVEREQAFALEERAAALPGVRVMVEPVRFYPDGEAMPHVLGYVGALSAEEYEALADKGYLLNDRIGKMGVEASYEEVLRGRLGREQVVVNAEGRPLEVVDREAPRTGHSLVLTLDLELQKRVKQALLAEMEESDYAAAVVLDPRTGEVLALVSLPSFDNNLFSATIDEEELARLLEDPSTPLLNHAIGGAYPPGSTFKLVTGSAALAEGVAAPSTRITSTGSITIASRYDPQTVYVFRDWMAHGELDFYGAIARSSDVYFYYLAGGYEDFTGLGAERLSQYAAEFGFGQPTGIELPGEAPGNLPSPQWKQETWGEPWFIGDTYNFGIGQGFLTATPLQMAVAVSAVANGGKVLLPQVVRQVVDEGGRVVRPFTPQVVRRLSVSDAHLGVVREGMRRAASPGGTATRAQVPGVEIAAKTGTAEFGAVDPVTLKHPTHGWFVAFAPFDAPEVALAVFFERGNGARNAARAAGEILRYYFGVDEAGARASGAAQGG